MKNSDLGPRREYKQRIVASLLDQLQARGCLVASLPDLANTSGLSPLAVKRQIEHLAHRVGRLPGRPSSYLIVAPEHRKRGAPPVDFWLADYCRVHDKPYYVGLLSAAALHGSAKQAVQLTQVMTSSATRAFSVGNVHVEFHVKQHLLGTPLTPIRGLASPLAVSSPEATALDLIAFQHCVGGIARATEVITGLLPVMTNEGWHRALKNASPTVRQRTGYVLKTLGARRFATAVQITLPSKLRPVVLQNAMPTRGTELEQPWQVIDNVGLKYE
jgi:predicted transcriptional regulator of viral defense system